MKGKGCCKEKEERKAQVRQALFGAWYESEADRDYAIDSFTRSTLSVEEISQLVQPLKEITSSVAKSKSKIFGSNNKAMEGMGGIA